MACGTSAACVHWLAAQPTSWGVRRLAGDAMIRTNLPLTVRRAGVLAALLVGLAVVALPGTPAAAAGPVGYVRLAHLSPDTPEVNVYLSKDNDASFSPQVIKGVGYGVVSKY